MLVLSRKSGEQLVIGPLTLTIVEIRGGRVRLGIDVPEDWTVLRQELFDRVPLKLLSPQQAGKRSKE